MRTEYPEIEPFDRGLLEVGDGQAIYWETAGNPDGKPAVILHGGPGSGCMDWHRRMFDPAAYLTVVLDQRGCGRSRPHAGDPRTDLSTNTTRHLVSDLERLREHLGIGRWLVWGGSWGCTLALAYAERHPERVTELILWGVTTTRRSELDWLYAGVGALLPEQWSRFRLASGSPDAERAAGLVAAYHRLVEDRDPTVREEAALAWCRWESAVLSPANGDPAHLAPRFRDPMYRMAFVRIVTHYFAHGAWLDDGALLRDAGRLAGIPGVMVHGRFDIGAPLTTAWELDRAWPDAELVVVENEGHSPRTAGIVDALIRAGDRFAP
jgi:proline iminopeptidase